MKRFQKFDHFERTLARVSGYLFVIFMVAGIMAVFLYAKLHGPHPECASIPDSVGPCDYWGLVRYLLPLGPLLAFASWLLANCILSGIYAIVVLYDWIQHG